MGWGPRGRVLGLVQENVWFVIGEENGVEDKAGEMRAQACDPQQGFRLTAQWVPGSRLTSGTQRGAFPRAP